ncbi:MAG TPA: hypothetical protein VMU30_12935 [Bacteroidota bacterium]|nr:hypothetical protein [Bacteroidota bacterium]
MHFSYSKSQTRKIKNQNNIHDSTQVSVQVSHNGSDSSFVKPATQENIPMKAAVQHPTKWTYRCVCCSTNEIDGYLNDNGAYGWELVAIIANYEPPLKLIFKKPIYE